MPLLESRGYLVKAAPPSLSGQVDVRFSSYNLNSFTVCIKFTKVHCNILLPANIIGCLVILTPSRVTSGCKKTTWRQLKYQTHGFKTAVLKE